MAVNQDFAGRTFPPGEPYEVSRVKIREFADAIGDMSPVYRDRDAAVAAGHPDVIAPPTFAIVISMANSTRAMSDPGLGLNYAMVVHGEQRFEYARPIQAGDVLVATSTIAGIRMIKSNTMITTETAIATVAGEHVCTAHSILVERG
ncbi:MAG TPA: MaoC family dehydratase N-terminal domain-containing protein [Streptosporangiaceae bacterium]|jgi:acyl dehydratase|nr:MaoC family dehydratase N-terminal domain-containing protein [Streptosporangiaceae bacterium]